MRLPSVDIHGVLRKSAGKLRNQKKRNTGRLGTRRVVNDVQLDRPENFDREVFRGKHRAALGFNARHFRRSRRRRDRRRGGRLAWHGAELVELTRRCAEPAPARRPWLGPPQPSGRRAPAASAGATRPRAGWRPAARSARLARADRPAEARSRAGQMPGRRPTPTAGAIGAPARRSPTPASVLPIAKSHAATGPSLTQRTGRRLLNPRRAGCKAGAPFRWPAAPARGLAQ